MKILAIVTAGAIAGAAAWDAATYDSRAWAADYAALKTAMAQGYANLDWIAEHRGLDVRALDQDTEQNLVHAYSRVRAYLALRRFVAAFGDPHLKLDFAKAQVPGPAEAARAGSQPKPSPPPTVSSCDAAGYAEGNHGFSFPYEHVGGWKALEEGNFPTGLIGDVGVLRIAQFGENRYLSACHRAFEAGLSGRALQLKVRALLQSELLQALETLKRQGARRLLVDLTGNSGGSEWVAEAIPLFTDRTMARHPARRVDPDCDRTGVWQGEPACSVFAPREELRTLTGTGAWTSPLLILVDRRTASASEDFAAWLQQNGAATLLGERTAGAGCGYINGGAIFYFRSAPLRVRMPNCARFLNDGSNEIEGLAPDAALLIAEPEKAAEQLARLLGT